MAKRPAEDLFRSLGDLFLGVLVVVVPFTVAVTAADPFRLPKLLASEWLGLASLVAYGLAAAVVPPEPKEASASPVWRRPIVLAVVPVLAVAGLGLVTSLQPVQTREALADLWIAGVCLIGWTLAVPARRLGRFLRATALPGSLTALLGVLQFHGVFRPFRFTSGDEVRRLGITALAGNPGDLGAFLVLPTLAAQWGLLRAIHRRRAAGGKGRRQVWIEWLWALALALCLYGIVVTQTLTALAALAAAMGVFWLLALPPRRALAAAVGAAVLAGVAIVAIPPLRSRVAQVGELAARGDWNQALTGRLDGWHAAVWMFREHPLTGVGHGAYGSRFGPAKLALQERGVEFYPAHVDPFFANAHNDFLEVLAEWGLLGAAALVWALGLLVRALLAGGAAASEQGSRLARAFSWSATVGAVVLAVGHFPFHLALVAYPYLVLLAWIFRRASEGEEVEA